MPEKKIDTIAKIQTLIHRVETQQNVKVLFAVESGSLVYGFPSADSDRDIRFVYYDPFIYPFEKYITYTKQTRTYEKMFNEELVEIKQEKSGLIFDLVGWHLYKYGNLLANSNPMTIEWLNSPIIYFGKIPIQLKEYASKNFKPIALFHHYYNICKKNFERMQEKAEINYKKYLYPLMGVFKALYVIERKQIPPISIQEAITGIKTKIPEKIKRKCFEIIQLKQELKEKDFSGRIEIFDQYLAEFITQYESTNNLFDTSNLSNDHETLNSMIRAIILSDYK